MAEEISTMQRWPVGRRVSRIRGRASGRDETGDVALLEASSRDHGCRHRRGIRVFRLFLRGRRDCESRDQQAVRSICAIKGDWMPDDKNSEESIAREKDGAAGVNGRRAGRGSRLPQPRTAPKGAAEGTGRAASSTNSGLSFTPIRDLSRRSRIRCAAARKRSVSRRRSGRS